MQVWRKHFREKKLYSKDQTGNLVGENQSPSEIVSNKPCGYHNQSLKSLESSFKIYWKS
jgi:hypothetical protein